MPNSSPGSKAWGLKGQTEVELVQNQNLSHRSNDLPESSRVPIDWSHLCPLTLYLIPGRENRRENTVGAFRKQLTFSHVSTCSQNVTWFPHTTVGFKDEIFSLQLYRCMEKPTFGRSKKQTSMEKLPLHTRVKQCPKSGIVSPTTNPHRVLHY